MHLFFLLNLVIVPLWAQFISPPGAHLFTSIRSAANTTVRYKNVTTGPDSICEFDGSVTSMSGYVDVSDTHHMFFWFFTARNVDPKTAPLTVWISGGPGDSSMSELFTENGPCAIEPETTNVYSNINSWTNYSNVIYIDQPVQVGFSYVDPVVNAYVDQHNCNITPFQNNETPCPDKYLNAEDICPAFGEGVCGTFSQPYVSLVPNSTEAAAPDFYLALQGFIGAFPQYVNGGFNFGSESYGGHYVPVFSRYILEQNNKKLQGHVNIPLQSVMIGNGWLDPPTFFKAYYNFSYVPGNTYDVRYNKSGAQESMYNYLAGHGQCLDQVNACNNPSANASMDDIAKACQSADDYCFKYVGNYFPDNLHRDEYDVREIKPSPFIYTDYINYLGLPNVLSELGVRVNYTDASDVVGQAFENTGDDSRELGIIAAIQSLLQSNISVTLTYGDADWSCNWYGGEASTYQIVNGLDGYEDAWMNQAGYVDFQTPDGITYGQAKQVGRLSFIRAYQSGHQVGFFKPQLNQYMFARTISGKDVATGKVDVTTGPLYYTQGSKASTYREGNRTVQYGREPDNAIYNFTSNEPIPEEKESDSSSDAFVSLQIHLPRTLIFALCVLILSA